MTQKTSSKKRRKYEADFKAEVLLMVASGKPVTEISQALGIGDNIIYRWKSKQRQASSPPGTAGQLADGPATGVSIWVRGRKWTSCGKNSARRS